MDDAQTPVGPTETSHTPPPSDSHASVGHGGDGHHDDHHHELGFWQAYVFSTDHKVIGIQYLITGLAFLLVGFILMLLMRWQLAYPGQPLTPSRFVENVSTSFENGGKWFTAKITGTEFKPTPFPETALAATSEETEYNAARMALVAQINKLNPAVAGTKLTAAQEALSGAEAWQYGANRAVSDAHKAVKKAEQQVSDAAEQDFASAKEGLAMSQAHLTEAEHELAHANATVERTGQQLKDIQASVKEATASIASTFNEWRSANGGANAGSKAFAGDMSGLVSRVQSGGLTIDRFFVEISALKLNRTWSEYLFNRINMPGGVMSPDFYNSLGAMHGTIMVFLAIVPLGFAAFGNYVMPLQIGAPDMTFPKLNMASYWLYLVGGVIGFASFFVPGGAAKSGWTSYSPLASTSDQPDIIFAATGTWWPMALTGQSLWLISLIILITSSLLGAVNFIATIIQLRCKGMSWMRMPFFVWAQFVTAFLLLLAFPPLEAACFMQLMDRVADTSFFLPTGLVVSGLPQMSDVSGGGAPLLWQHLFWFLAHPEVYVLILPAIGIIAEVIACNTRKPLWGYRALVYAIFVLGFLSFIVWAHHMYLTGMGTWVSTFFQATTIIISIPSVIILTALLISLWGGSIRFTVPMLFATAFLPMFGIGGLTGIPLAFNASDLYLHDTYYVIAHFHYIVAPGTIFGLFAGCYHWFPKMFGRKMSEFWGRVHFWPSFVLMNFIFMPMFLQGMAGMHRRWYDGGSSWELAKNVVFWNEVISISAFCLFLAQIPFIFNFFYSMFYGEKADANPWHATTLEWSTPQPPPHGNFIIEPVVDKGPYEYSVPGAPTDYSPQNATAPEYGGDSQKQTAPAH